MMHCLEEYIEHRDDVVVVDTNAEFEEREEHDFFKENLDRTIA